jgi:LysM repeat protein
MRSCAAVLILISLLSPALARSQSGELIVQGQTGKLYLEYTVVPKDNWYSIGRMYNLNPKVLASFNNLALDKGLSIGQVLEIPLTTINFSQDGKKTSAETLIPVIHLTQDKEWMYRISVNHNKVPIASLEKWNKITKDQVHPGMHLIVGFLKVKTALSALAKTSGAPIAATTVKPPATKSVAPDPPTDSAKTSTATTPPVTKPANTPPTTPPVTKPANTTPTTPPVTKPAIAPPTTVSTPAPHFNGGVFAAEFQDTGKSIEGQAGVFKSTSGWQDGKYYALMNNIPVGTIIKVTDPATNKAVFLKILGQLPEMKESVGLTIRISNAAAAEMGQTENRFGVRINY